MPAKTPNALLHGTLDALILKTLTGGPWRLFTAGVSKILLAQ